MHDFEAPSSCLRLDALRERAIRQRVTLPYAAGDKKMNHAIVLQEAVRTRTAAERGNADRS